MRVDVLHDGPAAALFSAGGPTAVLDPLDWAACSALGCFRLGGPQRLLMLSLGGSLWPQMLSIR